MHRQRAHPRTLQIPVEPLLAATQLEHRRHPLQQLHQIEVGGVHIHATSLDLGDVQHLVYQLEQVIAASLDGLDRVSVRLGQVNAVLHDLRVPDDGVHGSADLVTDVGQELRLGLVGQLRRIPGLAQLGDELVLRLSRIVEIAIARVRHVHYFGEGLDAIHLRIREGLGRHAPSTTQRQGAMPVRHIDAPHRLLGSYVQIRQQRLPPPLLLSSQLPVPYPPGVPVPHVFPYMRLLGPQRQQLYRCSFLIHAHHLDGLRLLVCHADVHQVKAHPHAPQLVLDLGHDLLQVLRPLHGHNLRSHALHGLVRAQAAQHVGHFGILVVDLPQHVPGDRTACQVEDIGHHEGAAHAAAGAHHIPHGGLQRLADLFENGSRDISHGGDPVRHISLCVLGQQRQDPRGLSGVQLREDQGNGLRVFVGDERRDLIRGRIREPLEPR